MYVKKAAVATVATFYAFNLNLQLNTVMLLTYVMLIYQPIEVLKCFVHL